MTEKNDESGFRVVDRRRFTEEGETRPTDAVSTPPAPAAAEPTKPTHAERPGVGQLPPLEFSHFVLSLATSAQIAMGLVTHPEAKALPRDLVAARQTIDIIAMLQEKTTGNLSADEAKLVEEIVYTLRLQYVQVSQGK